MAHKSHESQESQKSHSFRYFLNGAVSGLVGITISHPVDTIKSNIQDNKKITYNPRALYRGIAPAMVGMAFEKAVVFGMYDNTKLFIDRYSPYERCNIAISGVVAGFTSSMVVTPTERLKIISQTGKKITIHHLNPRTLFRGLSATFTREVPGFAIYFSTYNYLKKTHIDRTNEPIPLHAAFCYGGISGAMSWFGIYPQDLIKTRMQANITDTKLTFMQTAKQIHRETGVNGFFRGFHLALLRAVPLHAGTFMMMEVMKRFDKYMYEDE